MRDRLKANRVLASVEAHPVLIDVGASAGAPKIWAPIAEQSIYVGFDPDLREMRESPRNGFYKHVIVNEAVASDPSKRFVEFYLTRFPFCSSTLEPDIASLSNFHFRDRFLVEGKTTVAASTLDSILERLSLDRVDWLKVDTQGTDLRIFKSLSDRLRSRVLALDIEPGLIDAYRDEDLFTETHSYLSKHGFWLSDLNVGGAVRIRESSLQALVPAKALQYSFASRAIKQSPAYCEARYLRTLESLRSEECGRREYALLWVFAMLDHQSGFAMDVALEYQRVFGADETGALMKSQSVAAMKSKSVLIPAIALKHWVTRILGREAPRIS